MLHFGVGNIIQELHGGSGPGHEPGAIGSVANDQQAPPEYGAGVDGQIDALVRDQSRQHEIVVLLLRRGMEPVDIDRRVDHFGGAAIRSLDAGGHGLRVGDEMIGKARGALIPRT